MAISDADYARWLRADGKTRTLLIEAQAYSGVAIAHRYMSNRPFVSEPTDTPANQAYDDIVADVPSFVSRLSELFGGRASGSWGDALITNENGVRDAWLDDGWDGRPLSMFVGDPSWPRADYRSIMVGYSADLVAGGRNELRLRARDKTWATNVSIQKNLIGGSTANANVSAPQSYGQCFNVSPVLTNTATHEYQVHDGPIDDVTDVRDNGLTVLYTKDLANGKFTLNAAPVGRITADVRGAKPGGVYINKCADIVRHVVTTRTTLTDADIDLAAFTAFNTTCPQTLNRFIAAGEFMSVGTLLDELAASVGGFWTFDRNGLLTLGLLEAPTGMPALSLVADDVSFRGLVVSSRLLPVKVYRLGYRRNWTPQADGLAGAVTEANRALYAAVQQVAPATNGGVETKHLLAEYPDEVPSLLSDSTQAAAEASRRATLRSTLRYIYAARCYASPMSIRLGQVISLTYPRYGFTAGKLATVIGIRDYPTRARVELELFA